ncbi:MAG: phosphodiester glycosidase family protein [Moraxellaceae bacterium]|nr:phosphodiester glycosidase family protein [Moraxellaceae bacterium]
MHLNKINIIIISIFSLLTACEQQINSASNHQPFTKENQEKYCQTYSTPFIYTVCQVKQRKLLEHTDKLQLKLFWRENNDNTNKSAKPLYTFDKLKHSLSDKENLAFAMNAGMYNQNFAPIGYTVINNQQILSLNLKKGGGNFHLLPNGVFWWDNHGFYITESQVMSNMLKSGSTPKYATQSGPMLVINGKIHDKFKEQSKSKKIRNGVGVCDNGMIKFVTSNAPVNFYNFAKLFQEKLHCDNALFLDGGIATALYAPDVQRKDTKNMGVMIGLVENQ